MASKGERNSPLREKYTFASTYSPLNDISYMFLRMNPQLIDEQFVKIAYGSATDELLEGDTECARFKTELAIISECWVEQGQSAFERALTESDKPEWMQDMEAKLEKIRRGSSSLTLYVASQVPCSCLGKLVQKAEQELEKESAVQGTCDHGKPTNMSEE